MVPIYLGVNWQNYEKFISGSTRGTADYSWLQANYSFSFANYFDPNRVQFGALRVLNDIHNCPQEWALENTRTTT